MPYALWPCTDAAGSLSAQNVAPGNPNALVVAASRYGTGTSGGVTAAFGANSGALPGDPGGTTWQQTFTSPLEPQTGYCLFCADQNLPALSTGITITGWFTTNGSAGNLAYGVLMAGASAGSGNISTGSAAGFQLALDLPEPSIPYLLLTGTDGSTHEFSGTGDYYSAGWFHVALTLTAGGSSTTAEVYIDGVSAFGGTASVPLPPSISWVEFMGQADRYASIGFLGGSCAHLAVFAGILPADRIASICLAGSPNPQTVAGGVSQAVPGAQFAGEHAANRIERLLAYGGWTGPRAISQTSTTGMAAITDIQGTTGNLSLPGQVVVAAQGEQVSQAVNYIASSDGGWLYVDGNGVLRYASRGDLYNAPPQWTLGEDTAAGEIPYLPTAKIGYDKSLLYNSAQLTQSSGSGVPVVASNPPSIAQHSEYVYNTTVYNSDVNQILDLANWVVNTRGNVGLRIESLTVDAASNPSAWPFLLSICPGTPIRVNRRPQTGGAAITVDCIVAQVRKSFDYKAGIARVHIVTDTFPEGSVLSAGDAACGILDGTHPLGW